MLFSTQDAAATIVVLFNDRCITNVNYYIDLVITSHQLRPACDRYSQNSMVLSATSSQVKGYELMALMILYLFRFQGNIVEILNRNQDGLNKAM